MSEESRWKRCSTCKQPISFGAAHFACSVSTCNRKGTEFTFCSVECWDAHVPVYRHRDAWAEERQAPAAAAADEERPGSGNPGPRPDPRPGAGPPARPERAAEVPHDVLVVVSKLKAYVRARHGMNTSDDVVEVLSDRLRTLCDRAIANAREAGRKTVMARDFRGT